MPRAAHRTASRPLPFRCDWARNAPGSGRVPSRDAGAARRDGHGTPRNPVTPCELSQSNRADFVRRRSFGGARRLGVSPSHGVQVMGRYLLLWLLGVPIPILLLIWAFGGLH